MSTGLKANSDGSAAIQVGGTDVITLTSGGAATFLTSPTTVQAGTAAAPSITTSGDTNTGIFFPAADTIAFAEGGVESMRIDSDGDVGIGTSSPATRLHVLGTSSEVARFIRDNTAAASGGITIGNNSRVFTIYGDSNALSFWDTTANTERARITSDGYLLLGKTVTATGTAGITFGATADLGYSGFSRTSSTNAEVTLQVYSTGAAANRFYVGMAGTVFATSTTITGISDVRLKENIRDLDDGLNAVLELQPRKFDWKEGKGANIKDARGFIAQEFEQVFPDMIEQWMDEPPEGEEPYKAVNANLIPTLVKAIQEQQQMIEELKAKVAALEGAA